MSEAGPRGDPVWAPPVVVPCQAPRWALQAQAPAARVLLPGARPSVGHGPVRPTAPVREDAGSCAAEGGVGRHTKEKPGVSRRAGYLFSEGSARSTCLSPLGVVVVEPESSHCPSRRCPSSLKPRHSGSGRCGFREVRCGPWVSASRVGASDWIPDPGPGDSG